MTGFEFVLVGTGLDPAADDFEQRFFDAGCDDATIAFQNGHVLADFTREAPDLEAALISAVADFAAAGATLERIEPDPLVSLADMAERAGLTRAAMTNYAKGHRQRDFPAPVIKVSSQSPLWEWADVAAWLRANGRLSAAAEEQAAMIRAANRAIEAGTGTFAMRLQRELREAARGLELA